MNADDGGPALRRRLVADLEARGYLHEGSVRDAFLSVLREVFLADVATREGLDAVYRDVAYAAKVDAFGRWTSSSSQPAIMAAMLEALDLRPGLRVLEVGTGTGYNAALLARMVGSGGHVTTLDIDEDLVVRARPALAGVGVDVEALVANGRTGWPPRAPYDRIVITASSSTIERAWLDQLTDGGLLELPLWLSTAGLPGQVIVTFRRAGDALRSVHVLSGGFMALRDRAEVSTPDVVLG